MGARAWELVLGDVGSSVREPGAEPLFLAIARALARAIRSGSLRPGDALPGSRTLATALGVHRNTVLAALRELESEGWLETVAAKGTFVRANLPDPPPRALRGVAHAERSPSRIAFDVRGDAPSADAMGPVRTAGALARHGVLPLLGGIPDVRLVPKDALARAYRRALRSPGAAPLGYGSPYGEPHLREALGAMLGRVRGIGSAEQGLVVTRGSQMALAMAARAILEPGDVVAVEAMGYRPAWEALRLAGARVVPVPVDREGLDTSALAELCAREAVRAVYTTPHHQYPTTVLLSPGRRMRLLELARAHRFAIFEDDYDHEFHFDGRPALPLASADAHGSVVYIGTLSKILAPGLRIGFVVAPEPVADRVAALRTFFDRQGDLAVERAVAELLEDGEIQRHARRMRSVYRARRDALIASLERHLEGALTFHVPQGGLAIWARTSRAIDVEAWAERALRAGVIVHTGKRFAWSGRATPALRLGYAPLDEREIDVAVKRLARALTA
jgi:GntR family transcriptional regulator / MocR family aminotransferase